VKPRERDEDEEQDRGNEGVLDRGGEDGREDEHERQQQGGAGPSERAREHDSRDIGGLRGQQLPHRISDSAGKDGGAPLSPESARATVRGRGDGTGAAAADRASRWGQRRWDGGGGG
jgi:hypothetical protein